MAAGSDAGGEKSFAGPGTSMGVSAGASVARAGRSRIDPSIRIQSALVETRSTRLTCMSFLESGKGGRSEDTAPLTVPGTARNAAIKGLTVMRFVSGFLLKDSLLKLVCVCVVHATSGRRAQRKAQPPESKASMNSEASPIADMIVAATHFSGWPSEKAAQLTLERQAKTAVSNPVVASAAQRLQDWPRARSIPHTTESPPKTPPEISAVVALAGLERYPARPIATRKAP